MFRGLPKQAWSPALTFAFLFALISAAQAVPSQVSDDFTAKVAIASGTATFSFSLPRPGCVSIIAAVKGRKATERLWGPTWMEAGAWAIPLPTGRIQGKSGSVEFFSVSLEPLSTFGRSGRGERQFNHPMGIGWDPTQREIYVADTGNDRVVRLTPEGAFLAQYGGFGVAFGEKSEEKEDSLDEPWDVAPGGFSNFYVSDQNNDRIAEFDAYKNFKGPFFPKKSDRQERLSRPRGLMVDTENNLWIVDGRADRVLKFSPSGTKLFEMGGFGWSTWQFKDPTQVAIDNEGRIYVSDRGNHRVQVFDRLGSHLFEIRDHLKSPMGVAVDPEGIVYVCDESTGELGLYSGSGKRIGVYAKDGQGTPFRSPTDMVVLKDLVYLADSGNNRIVVFTRATEMESRPWQGPGAMIK